jgi:hypothetical protein
LSVLSHFRRHSTVASLSERLFLSTRPEYHSIAQLERLIFTQRTSRVFTGCLLLYRAKRFGQDIVITHFFPSANDQYWTKTAIKTVKNEA